MSDYLDGYPNGIVDWTRPKPVVIFGKNETTGRNTALNVDDSGSLAINHGEPDALNTTTALLGANETFTGEWVTDNNPHFAVNFLADQDGTLYVDFSPDGGTTVTLTKQYDYWANEPRFDVLIKLPGRSHRVRFVNGSTAQTQFILFTTTGDGLFPFAVSDRDEPVFAAYQAANVSATEYALIVDLSDTVNFPHSDVGRADLWSAFFFVDKGSNTVGAIQLGVITRIDATDAAISFVQGVSFNSADARAFARDRLFIKPLRLGQSGGKLTRVSTQFKLPNEPLVNTATTLPSAEGNITPAVGDLVVRFLHTSGSAFTGTASIQYAGNVSTT